MQDFNGLQILYISTTNHNLIYRYVGGDEQET